MKSFNLRILTPERPFYEGEAVSLVFPASDGSFGVQANHSPMIAAVVPGALSFTTADGQRRTASVSEGFIRANKDGAIVLVDSAERPEEINVERAVKSGHRAQEELERARAEHVRFIQNDLHRALSRIKVKRDYEKNK